MLYTIDKNKDNDTKQRFISLIPKTANDIKMIRNNKYNYSNPYISNISS